MPSGAGKVDSFIHQCPRPRPHRGGPQDAQVIRAYIPVDPLAGWHASHQADRRGEMTSYPLKQWALDLKLT